VTETTLSVGGRQPGHLPAPMPHSGMFSLAGKTAVVSGCRRGIGRAMAVALAEAGADIVGIGTDNRLHELEALVLSFNRHFCGYGCDFRDRSQIYALIDRLRTEVPAVDILVNNAGIIRRRRSVEHSDDDWNSVLDVDLTAHFIVTRELGRPMLERGTGKIIFVASLLSFQGGLTVPSYAAAKGGIAQLTKALANEWAPFGVNVNAIAPGYIRTDSTRDLQADEIRNRQIVERIPAGRWGEPEDLKGAIVFLASRASDYVHGSVLPVDGGWLAR
jgi:2-deoxy-D-gluconate 3-dehydrogenase